MGDSILNIQEFCELLAGKERQELEIMLKAVREEIMYCGDAGEGMETLAALFNVDVNQSE